jgi:hypothetical protein
MSQSRSNIKNFIRTGQFSRRFNVSKPTDMPDIPEDKPVDSSSASEKEIEKEKDKRTSVQTTVSELSTTSTKVDAPLGITVDTGKGARSPQPGDLLFIPPDIKTPTTFGPNDAYTAVPTVVTYSAARGMSRITVSAPRPSKSDRPLPAHKDLSPISEAPPYIEAPPPAAGIPVPLSHGYHLPSDTIPLIAPPPGFHPVSSSGSDGSARSESSHGAETSPRLSHLSQGSESIRTSTASESIRTSTASTVLSNRASHATAISNSPQDGDIGSENGSAFSYVTTPPGSPPTTTKPQYSQMPSNSASWPLPAPSAASKRTSPTYSAPYFDSIRGSGSVPGSHPSHIDNAHSRFSWHVSNTDKARNWFTRWFVEWWLMEILSWCFSSICMIIIAIVLIKFDGKQLPQWHLGITINAFISIFSGFAKSALLLPTAEALGQLKWNWFRKEKKMMDFEILDSASRGPWGSFVLLSRTKGM